MDLEGSSGIARGAGLSMNLVQVHGHAGAQVPAKGQQYLPRDDGGQEEQDNNSNQEDHVDPPQEEGDHHTRGGITMTTWMTITSI